MPPPITRSKSPTPIAPDSEQKLPETLEGQQSRSKLPPELLRNIVEEVSLSISDAKSRNHTLFNLLLTSSDLHREARRLLYRDIIFVQNTTIAGQISDALHAGAAKYVRSLRVEDFVADTEPRGRSAKTDFLHLPLNLMDGLRSLDLSESPMRDFSSVAEFLQSSVPANILLKFSALVPIDDDILPFLQQQKNIQFLSLYRLEEPSTFLRSPQLMPNLRRLKIYILHDVDFEELLENRPITVFRFDSFFRLPNCWSTFAPRLHALDISHSVAGVYDLKKWIEVIATVAINLRLFACFGVSFNPGAVPTNLPAVFSLLSKLRHLEVLTVSFVASSIGDLDVMTIPEVVSTPAQLRSIFVAQRLISESADAAIIHELRHSAEGGWVACRRDGASRDEWIESSLRDLGLAYC
ncbi:hypothetical protein SISSUDRAFT_1129545 [Sistotremastrum suecicum HHB10207 ss-3]|uniref:F-box domain-containing protein n=1 Tax=Sistotremastrum suecicum HHB10207 ss-3 TaxID=1314776 RepID=A0A166CJA6_9AGAM|nr:hypothetical protein SISSUDRAFT_1129545 [Sistotremastrum suecicum HHB10207 ss-3]